MRTLRADQSFLRNALQLHGNTILSRWGNRGRDQRAIILPSALPGMEVMKWTVLYHCHNFVPILQTHRATCGFSKPICLTSAVRSNVYDNQGFLLLFDRSRNSIVEEYRHVEKQHQRFYNSIQLGCKIPARNADALGRLDLLLINMSVKRIHEVRALLPWLHRFENSFAEPERLSATTATESTQHLAPTRIDSAKIHCGGVRRS